MAKKIMAMVLMMVCACMVLIGCTEDTGEAQIQYRNQTLSVQTATENFALQDIVQITGHKAITSSKITQIDVQEEIDAFLRELFPQKLTFVKQEQKEISFTDIEITIMVSSGTPSGVSIGIREDLSAMTLRAGDERYVTSIPYSLDDFVRKYF